MNTFRIALTIFFGLMLAACAAGQPTPIVSHGNEIGGYVDLIDALRAAGAEVEPAGGLEQPFFTVGGQMIRLNGLDVQVFEYADEAGRAAEAELIAPDGGSVGTTMITWIDQPHFWAKGRLIVLYVGQDSGALELLHSVLGDPVTEAEDPTGGG